jgi:hypothetical protein
VTDAYAAPFRFTGDGLVVRYHLLDDRDDGRDDERRAAEMDARAAIAEQ